MITHGEKALEALSMKLVAIENQLNELKLLHGLLKVFLEVDEDWKKQEFLDRIQFFLWLYDEKLTEGLADLEEQLQLARSQLKKTRL